MSDSSTTGIANCINDRAHVGKQIPTCWKELRRLLPGGSSEAATGSDLPCVRASVSCFPSTIFAISLTHLLGKQDTIQRIFTMSVCVLADH
jgi:hypothetical protein